MLRAIVIIPARYGSTRFPGKALAPLRDRTLIEWVWRGAKGAGLAGRVLVATDDARIARAVEAFGGEAAMTLPECRSGADRIARVAADLATDVVVNVQGDEPFVTGSSLDRLIAAFGDPSIEVATLREPFRSLEDLFDPNQVKVVTGRSGDALYFSRAPIPHLRTNGPVPADPRQALASRPRPLEGYWKHVGVYAYRRETLLEFARTDPTPLETAESLEQLRLLETGHRIRVLDADFRSVAVDTPQDLRRAAQALEDLEEGR